MLRMPPQLVQSGLPWGQERSARFRLRDFVLGAGVWAGTRTDALASPSTGCTRGDVPYSVRVGESLVNSHHFGTLSTSPAIDLRIACRRGRLEDALLLTP